MSLRVFKPRKRSILKTNWQKKILKRAGKIYREIGEKNGPAPFVSFLKNRNLSPEIAGQFQLGFAPGGNILTNYLKSIPDEGVKSEALLIAQEIGLIKRDQKNPEEFYDTFRERVIFPIWDQSGSIQGFTSRAIHDYQKAKYMNSPASYVFDKKNLLYGLNFAKSFLRTKNKVLICEGNMDAISLHKNGFTETVAIMGTALGERALGTLSAYTKNFYLCLDNDPAGREAAKRINHMSLVKGIIPNFIDITPHKDPDDFLENESSLAFQQRIDEAKPFLDVLLDEIIPEIIPTVSDRKLDLLKEMFELVSPLKNELSATERLIHMAKRLGLNSGAEQILSAYGDFLKAQKSPAPAYQALEPARKSNAQDHEVVPNLELETPLEVENIEEVRLTRGLKLLVSELTAHPECIMHKTIGELLDLVHHNEVKSYVLRLRNLIFEIDEGEYPKLVQELINKENYALELKEVIGAALFSFKPHDPANKDNQIIEKLLLDVRFEMEKDFLFQRKIEIKNLLKNCITEEEMNVIMTQLLKVDKELNSLKSQKQKLN